MGRHVLQALLGGRGLSALASCPRNSKHNIYFRAQKPKLISPVVDEIDFCHFHSTMTLIIN